VHHFATLIGYGASAINPYLLLETLDTLVAEGRVTRAGADGAAVAIGSENAAQNLVKAIGKGLLKTISKMGISTIQSYRGAQIFEAVGLDKELIDTHFTHTASRIGGVGVEVLAAEALERHARAYPGGERVLDTLLPVGGVYAWRRDGEHHMWNPETIALVQHAVRAANGDVLIPVDEPNAFPVLDLADSDSLRRSVCARTSVIFMTRSFFLGGYCCASQVHGSYTTPTRTCPMTCFPNTTCHARC